jgi:alanine racemase
VEISEERLAANYDVLTQVAGDAVTVLTVIKANAYGHDAKLCAPVLARVGTQWLGVTDAEEGIAVRAAMSDAGLSLEQQPSILVMSGLLQEDAEAIVQHRLTPVVWTTQQMAWLAEAIALHNAEPLPVHLEIDTGMARQGVAPHAELHAVLDWVTRQPKLQLTGVMTHFASSEIADSPLTRQQRQRFEQAISAVVASGQKPNWVHAGSSSTVDNSIPFGDDPGSLNWLSDLASGIGARAMVRTGVALYGYCLPIEASNGLSPKPQVREDLRPVMSWKTSVIGVREIQTGDTVGYNSIYTASRPMRLALLPVGYADGLRRELSSSDTQPGGWVMLHRQRAMIVGRVSMNLTIVDVTDIPHVNVGDEVTLLGDGITADDHARLAGTISYEIVCGMRAAPRLLKTAE